MPSPGDPVNLQPNLAALAQLVNKPGSKLSYDKNRGRFSVQDAGVLQTLARTFSSDSVISEEYFGAPIRELFAAARPETGKSIQLHDVTQAVNGLKALRNTYTNERDKLAILDVVIEDAELGVKKDPAGVIRLRQRYQQYLRFGFAQAMFLPESNRGVCYSFTVHWARRILLGRTYFGMSKKKAGEASPLTPDAAQKARMMKKVDRNIRPLQAELKNWAPSSFGTVVMQVGREEEQFAKYGNLMIVPYTSDKQQIGDTERGSDVMQAVLGIANPLRAGVSIFLVNLAAKNGPSGHTIGIHLDGALHFFDSNFGEFAFPNGSEGDLKRFLDEWWEAFYMVRGPGGLVQHFGSWQLEGVSMR